MTVDELERALFAAFPAVDAEAWDHVGLSVGDRAAEVKRIYVTLDATVDDVHRAYEAGANVVVAHHPVYIKAPSCFSPSPNAHTPQAAAAVFEAARLGVAIISMHTNLDRSHEARDVLAQRLGMRATGSLEHPDDVDSTGFGCIFDAFEGTLLDLAMCAAQAFHTEPRVWGDPNHVVTRVGMLGGSLGDLGELAVKAGLDAIVCGECGYHICQDLDARGVHVILLGHDASEAAFAEVLTDAMIHAGVEPAIITTNVPPRAWWTCR